MATQLVTYNAGLMAGLCDGALEIAVGAALIAVVATLLIPRPRRKAKGSALENPSTATAPQVDRADGGGPMMDAELRTRVAV
ncbi:hypothetical protein [Streptomyces sp. NPDC051677]|uniref:hypothetical protein n=1 Tax=Streptomyces sp. NPDC051677 TaxID=3365669 RepID=UPI0037D6207E